jgi:cobalt-zinc-cadmium efflux system membrane fusion protein
LIVLTVAFEAAASQAEEAHNEHEEGAIKLSSEVLKEFGVELDTVTSGTISFSTTLPGEVQINQDRLAHVVPRYPGVVLEVKKKIGDVVSEEDVLAWRVRIFIHGGNDCKIRAK